MSVIKFKQDIQKQIRNNYFRSKEELYEYILKLNKNINSSALTNQEIEELLELYDELHTKSESPLDMENYSNKKLDNKNFIVSEADKRVLKTTENTNEFIHEFKQTQNQILAHNQDGTTNAREVFNKLADTKKEEITLLPLHEAIIDPNVDKEIIYKIKFLITKMQINPYSFKVNITTGIFYNYETNEMYEVRKNEKTNQYEIYVSGEIKYDNTNNIENEQENTLSDHDEENIHKETKNKPKVRTRKPEQPRYFNNAAFTNIGFLIISITSLTIIGILIGIIILNK